MFGCYFGRNVIIMRFSLLVSILYISSLNIYLNGLSFIKRTVELLRGKGLNSHEIKSSLDLLKYIYIGENIRNEGILQNDDFINEHMGECSFLLESEFIEEKKWYNHNLYKVSPQARKTGRELVEEAVGKGRDNIKDELKNQPQKLISFLVREYIDNELTFGKDKASAWDWKRLILENDEVEKVRKFLFSTLGDGGLCVVTRSYVSTRGGELREECFVISPEIRAFLFDIYLTGGLNQDEEAYCKLYDMLLSKLLFLSNEAASIEINGDEIRRLGSIDIFYPKLKSFLEGLVEQRIIDNLYLALGGNLIFTVIEKYSFEACLKSNVRQIVKTLFEKEIKDKVDIKVEDKVDFPQLVQTLVIEKHNLYQMAAQFDGKEIFKCSPETERCIIRLTNPSQQEEVGLKSFILDLHQFILESSTSHVLKFRPPPDFVSLQQWLRIEEFPEEQSKLFEEASEFFKDINQLRNCYSSHLPDAKGIYEAGNIFNKLIGKRIPKGSDIPKTEKILLEKTIDSLASITRVLESSLIEK